MSHIHAIGDIHGHHTELMNLYQQLLDSGMVPQRDVLVFLGDYVDGGPHTRQVLDQLIAWQQEYPHWVFLKGNHEDLMLDALVFNSQHYGDYYLWWSQGGRETAQSYLPESATDYERAIMQPDEFISTQHLAWLGTLALMHETDAFFFVHAGFRPGFRMEGQREEDMLWIREGFFLARYNFGKPVVFGHTVFEEPYVVHDNRPGHEMEIVAIGINTMSRHAGALTAVTLDPDLPHAEPRFLVSDTEPEASR